MRIFSAVAIIVLLSALLFYNAFKTDRIIKEKVDRIKELEQQVWELKLDTLVKGHTARFEKKLDSIFRP